MPIVKAIDLLNALEEIQRNDPAFPRREISVKFSSDTLDEVSHHITYNDLFVPDGVTLHRDINEVQIVL